MQFHTNQEEVDPMKSSIGIEGSTSTTTTTKAMSTKTTKATTMATTSTTTTTTTILPPELTSILQAFQCLNTIYTFSTSQSDIIPTYQSLASSISRLLNRPFQLFDLGMISAVAPSLIHLEWKPIHEDWMDFKEKKEEKTKEDMDFDNDHHHHHMHHHDENDEKWALHIQLMDRGNGFLEYKKRKRKCKEKEKEKKRKSILRLENSNPSKYVLIAFILFSL